MPEQPAHDKKDFRKGLTPDYGNNELEHVKLAEAEENPELAKRLLEFHKSRFEFYKSMGDPAGMADHERDIVALQKMILRQDVSKTMAAFGANNPIVTTAILSSRKPERAPAPRLKQ
jgi:hypothetical protein